MEFRELPVGKQIYMPRGWHTLTLQGKKLLLSGPFQASPYVSLHLRVH